MSLNVLTRDDETTAFLFEFTFGLTGMMGHLSAPTAVSALVIKPRPHEALAIFADGQLQIDGFWSP